jgi:hypothetical protein
MVPHANAVPVQHVIEAPLTYLLPGERPVSYTFEPPPGVPWRTGTYADVMVPVADGRGEDFDLDINGFAFIKRASAVSDFSDAHVLRSVYMRECEQIMRAATGAIKVLAFDYNLRSGAVVGRAANGVREPVRRVHNDFTLKSGPRRAADELRAAGEDPEHWLAHRFALINLWRPIRGPVRATPLAVCDAESLTLRDFVETDLVYRDRVGETYTVTHSPRHRWFYFPDMRTDEALLLKCYDSSESGLARFTAHTAFDDPTTSAGTPPRESIEMRMLVIYGTKA